MKSGRKTIGAVHARIRDRLRAAVAAGETKTRHEWAREFGCKYEYLTIIMNRYDLSAAAAPLRAESGIIKMQPARKGDWIAVCLRIPHCAIAAAGFESLQRIAWRIQPAQDGQPTRIILEAEAP